MHVLPESPKEALYAYCRQYVRQRIDTAKSAMDAAQAAANEESKSSAGDKYETGRAMAQIERDRHAQLLTEALKLEADLALIDVDKSNETVRPGSLVSTERGRFFISISVGKITLDGTDYFAVSSVSPIGALLLNRRIGEQVVFNRMTYTIQAID